MNYDIKDITDTTFTFYVTPIYGYIRYRLFWRPTSEQDADRVEIIATEEFTYTVYGLQPNTSYTVNVAYSPSESGEEDFSFMGPSDWVTRSPRPNNWGWESYIASRSQISITASEWNDFCSRINEFRHYTKLGDYNFTSVSRGDKISASVCNEAWYAINEIDGRGSMPSQAVRGGEIYASFFTGLRNALNSIP